jgi:hypothetical protein
MVFMVHGQRGQRFLPHTAVDSQAAGVRCRFLVDV